MAIISCSANIYNARMNIIELFGDEHNSDYLLQSRADLFARMQAKGSLTGFIETTPNRQPVVDTDIAALHAQLDSGQLVADVEFARICDAYNAAPRDQRHPHYRAGVLLLAAHHGIKLVCSDVADRSFGLYAGIAILAEEQNISLARAHASVNREQATVSLGIPADTIGTLMDEIAGHIANGTFEQGTAAALTKRSESDVDIGHFIHSQLQPHQSTFGLFGIEHVNMRRTDSLASTLVKLGNMVSVYSIDPVSGALDPIFNPARSTLRGASVHTNTRPMGDRPR